MKKKQEKRPAFLKRHPQDSASCSRAATDSVLRAAGIDWDEIPVVHDLDAQILAIVTKQPSRLDMSVYHSSGDGCGTAHCRAGWAVVLGKAKELERRASVNGHSGAHNIGAAIYIKSNPKAPTPDFYASNDDAIADMHDRVLAQVLAERKAAKRIARVA